LDNRIPIKSIAFGAIGLVAIAMSEVFSPVVYKDSVGIDTIGYGETLGVRKTDRTTPERALVQLLVRVDSEYATGVKECVKTPLFQYEFDAYVNLTYNIGVNAFCKSTIVKELNNGNYQEACTGIKRFNRAGGKVVQGLINRREREYQMCIGK
jgi:lysozyme